MGLKDHEQRTKGVNYDPGLARTQNLTEADQESVSSAPMHFAISAEVGGSTVELNRPRS
jgi:hypothetical protein